MHLARNICQVMLDTANHPELSDYIRVMVFNTTDPFASIPVDISKVSMARGSPRAGRRGQSQTLMKPLSSNDAEGSRHIGPKPAREASIRFTGFLPEEHALTKIAKQLHQARLAAGARGESWTLISTSWLSHIRFVGVKHNKALMAYNLLAFHVSVPVLAGADCPDSERVGTAGAGDASAALLQDYEVATMLGM